MVAADLSCYTQFLELQNWFVQHALLLCVPMYLLYLERYPIIAGRTIFLFSYALEFAAHAVVFIPVSLAVGFNINYTICPPAGPLELFHSYYRVVMMVFCLFLMWFVRYVLIQSFLHFVRRRRKAATGAEEEGDDDNGQASTTVRLSAPQKNGAGVRGKKQN